MNKADKEGWNTIVAIFGLAMIVITAIVTAGLFLFSESKGARNKKTKYKVANRISYDKRGRKHIGTTCNHEHNSVESAMRNCMVPNYDLIGDVVAIENNEIRELDAKEADIFNDVFLKEYLKTAGGAERAINDARRGCATEGVP